MSLETLPDELIVELLKRLLNDPTSFRQFTMTNKRFCQLAQGTSLINSSDWTHHRPNPFVISPILRGFDSSQCQMHGRCSEFIEKTGTNCEVMYQAKEVGKEAQPTPRAGSSIEDRNESNDKEGPPTCYYHRLNFLLQTKFITFSSLKFIFVILSGRSCIRPLMQSTRLKVSALVELELNDCDITLDWLNTILNEMDAIAYLSLNGVTFTDPSLLVESRYMASKKLKRLRIAGDRRCSINDSIFLYFFENFPAVEFDLTGTRVEYHKRIIARYYKNASSSHVFLTNPSEYVFTFPMVMLYLRKYQSVVKRFIADETDITLTNLVRIIQDEELEHLKVSVRNCPLITQFWGARSTDRIAEEDLRRVIF